MTDRNDTEHLILPRITRATEHSAPFSDLRADDDTRLLRLWTRVEHSNEDSIWRPLDIARGGRTIVGHFESIEHGDTRQNADLVRQMSRSAFILFQPDRLTDRVGNIAAVTLGRKSSQQLGKLFDTPFDIFRDEGVALHHAGIYVDDDDGLAIEAHDIDYLPQVEVVAADSDTAVHIGHVALSKRDYLRPERAIANATQLIADGKSLPPLSGSGRPVAQQSSADFPNPFAPHSIIRKS